MQDTKMLEETAKQILKARRKVRLKAKLAKMSPADRKAYIIKLKERRKAKLASAPSAAAPTQPTHVPPPTDEDILLRIINEETIGIVTKKDHVKLTRGLTLNDLFKGLKALAVVSHNTLKLVREMHTTGVSRRPELPSGSEVNLAAMIDPRKLYAFVKSIPNLWQKWACDEAVCWQCPYHRGKGIAMQNQHCATAAVKEALKHNAKVGIAKAMPIPQRKLRKMPRRRLVQVLGLLGISVFKLKNGSKNGIISFLSEERQKKLYKPHSSHSVTVTIPASLTVDKENHGQSAQPSPSQPSA